LLFNFVMHCIISTVVVAFEINYLILSYRKRQVYRYITPVWNNEVKVVQLSLTKTFPDLSVIFF